MATSSRGDVTTAGTRRLRTSRRVAGVVRWLSRWFRKRMAKRPKKRQPREKRLPSVLSAALAAAVTLAACVTPATQGGDPAHDAVLRYCERFAAAAPARLLSLRILRRRQRACRSPAARRRHHLRGECLSTPRFPVRRCVAVHVLGLDGRKVLHGRSGAAHCGARRVRRLHEVAPLGDHQGTPDRIRRGRDDRLRDAEVLRETSCQV